MLKIVNSNEWQEMHTRIAIQRNEIAKMQQEIRYLRHKLATAEPHRDKSGRFAKKER